MLLCSLNSVIFLTVLFEEYDSEQTFNNDISLTLDMHHLNVKLLKSDSSMIIDAVIQTELKEMN